MGNATLNVSRSKEQLTELNREVESGQYVSATEVVRGALRQRLKRFFRMISSDLLAKAATERALLLQYLDYIKLFSREPVGLVDIGWAASILRSLHDISAIEGRKLNATGFFFATWATAEPVAERGRRVGRP